MAVSLGKDENLFLLADVSSQVDFRLICEWTVIDKGSVCGESFECLDSLQEHIRTSHLSELGDCLWRLCSFRSTNAMEFTCHVLFHGYHSYLKSKGEQFRVQKNLPTCRLATELIPKVEADGFRCQWMCSESQICEEIFDCVSTYYSHVKGHVDAKIEARCCWQGCVFESANQWKLKDHVRTHTQEKVISCPHCGSLFSNTSKFRDHLDRQVTPADSPHVCVICHKKFNSDRLLNQHFRKHVNTQKCPYCEMTCASSSALTYHLRYRHSQGKPHQCPICLKNYKTQYSLADHLQLHGEKTICCEHTGCNYITSSVRSYRQHVRLEHSDGSVVFCCHVCDEQFSEGHKLTAHLKKVHGFSLPPGHSRFRYIEGPDGMRRLQTVRLDDKSIAASLNS